MGNYQFFMVSLVYSGVTELYLLFCKLCPFKTSYQFFAPAGKHRTAYHFYPTKLFFVIYCIFEKHFVIFNAERKASPVHNVGTNLLKIQPVKLRGCLNL